MEKNLQVLVVIACFSIGTNSKPHWRKEYAHASANCSLAHGGMGESEKALTIVPRAEWEARPPKRTTDLRLPVPFVIIHHSYIPAACTSLSTCAEAMRRMQSVHQDANRWDDIGYNFAIGGDGRVYTGRGWTYQGAHAPTYNNQSIGICFIGDYTNELPSTAMVAAAHNLIALGVKQGYIYEEFKLYGHRQVRADTECPGDRFYEEVTTWPHWDATPPRKYKPDEGGTTEIVPVM